jgi:hypothetical protein
METFVPEDLQFMGVAAEHLHATNPWLVPLIPHDRAGLALASPAIRRRRPPAG